MMDHGMMMTMQQKQNGLYKTQICKHYKEGNPCNMADKCSFAHGEHELRGKDLGMMMPQMAVLGPTPYNNYKTKKCKFFTEEGRANMATTAPLHMELMLETPTMKYQLRSKQMPTNLKPLQHKTTLHSTKCCLLLKYC